MLTTLFAFGLIILVVCVFALIAKLSEKTLCPKCKRHEMKLYYDGFPFSMIGPRIVARCKCGHYVERFTGA